MSLLVIRADAGGLLGTGHVMRMLALAQAWRRRGGRVIIATAHCPDELISRIVSEGFDHRVIPCEAPGDVSDARATLQLVNGWLVLDGYHFQEAYQQACRDAGVRTLCVDDFGHCNEWFCNVLLNQNLGAPVRRNYPAVRLLGISYALLRQEFLQHPRRTEKWGSLQKILVTLGGSDPPNATGWILLQLAKVTSPDLIVRVIIGPANPHREALRSLNLPMTIEWKESVTDMPAEYAWADGVISAGGSSCWEWLSFGLPGVVVTIADNQEPIVAELTKEKVALCLGWPDKMDRSETLAAWLECPFDEIDQAKAASLIDGRGADRVVAVLDGSRCLIRATDPVADARFTFDLANDPIVRAAGYSTKEIFWYDHCTWLRRHHLSNDSHLYIIESSNGESVGSLRFHRADEAWEIGIALTRAARGHGYADKGIFLGMSELAILHHIRNFTATIRPTNTSSKNLFHRLGFRHQSSEDDREFWTYHLP